VKVVQFGLLKLASEKLAVFSIRPLRNGPVIDRMCW
jgi:hypothetical protein